MTTEKCINYLKKQIDSDSGYKMGWIANIAMAYIDSEYQYKKETGKTYLNNNDKRIVANRAAEYFINLLFK